jgi:flagellin-like hook-associated protein FlgL
MEITQNRLSTGKRVNSALDDPIKYFSAMSHTHRAGDLLARKDRMSEAIQTIKAANNGIEAITQLIQSARSLAQSALSTENQSKRDSLSKQFDEILNQINLFSNDSGYRGVNFLDGTDQILEVFFNESGESSLIITGIDASAKGLGLVGWDVLGFDDLDSNGEGVGSAPYFGQISNGHGGLNWQNVFWLDADYLRGAGFADGTVSGEYISVPFSPAIISVGNGAFDFRGVFLTALNIDDTSVTVNGYVDGVEQYSRTVMVDTNGPAWFEANFIEIDTLAIFSSGIIEMDEFSYRLVNQSGIAIQSEDWSTNANIENAIQRIDSAIATLRAKSITLSANLNVITSRQDFTQGMVNTLTEGASNLTNADMNEEAANMLMLQTRQLLGSTSLSLAAQAEQSVLSLFLSDDFYARN